MKTTTYKGSDLNPSFKRFARQWAKMINSITGIEVLTCSIGFYYWSMFFTYNGKMYNIFCSDVRYFKFDTVTIREVKNVNDFHGGQNHSLPTHGFGINLCAYLNRVQL